MQWREELKFKNLSENIATTKVLEEINEIILAFIQQHQIPERQNYRQPFVYL